MLVSRTGKHTLLSSYCWQLLDKVQTILELMMFLLISLGWKFLRNTLNLTEVRFAVGISVISFYLGVFEIICKTPSTCSGYKLSRYILHSLCYLVIIVAMNFNLQVIYSQIADFDWDSVWAYKLLLEMVCWVIYASVMYAFRPSLDSIRVFELTIREAIADDEDDDDMG